MKKHQITLGKLQPYELSTKQKGYVIGGTFYQCVGWEGADPWQDPDKSFMDIVLVNGDGEWVDEPKCHIPDREGLGMIG